MQNLLVVFARRWPTHTVKNRSHLLPQYPRHPCGIHRINPLCGVPDGVLRFETRNAEAFANRQNRPNKHMLCGAMNKVVFQTRSFLVYMWGGCFFVDNRWH